MTTISTLILQMQTQMFSCMMFTRQL